MKIALTFARVVLLADGWPRCSGALVGYRQRPRARWARADDAYMPASTEGFRGFCTRRVGAAEYIFPQPIAARIGASAAEIWASKVRQAAHGYTTAATRSALPTHGAALGYRACCGGPIGLVTLCDAPTLSSACALLLQMAHPSWCIRLPLECRNVAPAVFSAESSVRATHVS